MLLAPCERNEGKRRGTHRSRMNSIRSFAKRFKLDRHEKPKSASVKKNMPSRFWKPAISFVMFWKKNPQMTAFHEKVSFPNSLGMGFWRLTRDTN